MSRSATVEASTAREVSTALTESGATDITPGDALVTDRLTVNNFDLLRLVFAMMVVVFHIGVLSQAPALSWLRDGVSATFGLQGFFVVSGFLVTMSYDRSSSLASYAMKRARRIAPAYVVVVIGAAVGLVLVSQLPWQSYFSAPQWRSYVFWNLLLANFVSPDLPGVFADNYKQAVNGSLWTIKVEVAFYLMVPIFALLYRRYGFWKVMAILFAASIAWRIGFDVLGRMTERALWSKLAIQAPGQFAFFVAGAVTYERTRLGLPPPRMWMAVAAVAAYALSSDLWHELIAPLAVGIVVYWAAVAAPYLGRASRHGDFSYGIYLYHWPVVQTLLALGVFATSPLFGAACTLAIVLAMAVASWFMIERRFLSQRRVAGVG